MIDEKDIKILELLKNNAKLTTQQISKKLLIPITTVHNRVKKMEKMGIIKGYTLKIDYKKLGKGILAIILANVSYTSSGGKKVSQEWLASLLRKNQDVENVYIVTGGQDIIIQVRVSDIEALNEFVINNLRNMEGIERTTTLIVLSSPE